MPKVSILTPAYFSEDFIGRAVLSVLAQSMQDWELLIISDDQQDYEQILSRQGIADSRLRFLTTFSKGSGPSRARNVGLESATGEVVAMLDADDAFHPHKLETTVPLAERHGLVATDILFLDHATGQQLKNCNKTYPEKKLTLPETFFAVLHGCNVTVFRRSLLGTLRWPETISRMEDAVLLAQLFDRVGGCYYLPTPLHHYYRREGSLCNVPQAGFLFAEAIRHILSMLQAGSLDFAHEEYREVLRQFLLRQLKLELLFEENLSKGLCVDYQDFIQKNLAIFHRFDS